MELKQLRKKLADAEMERDILKKGREHFLRERQEIYRFMNTYRLEFTVGKMCKVFNKPRLEYFNGLKHGTIDSEDIPLWES